MLTLTIKKSCWLLSGSFTYESYAAIKCQIREQAASEASLILDVAGLKAISTPTLSLFLEFVRVLGKPLQLVGASKETVDLISMYGLVNMLKINDEELNPLTQATESHVKSAF